MNRPATQFTDWRKGDFAVPVGVLGSYRERVPSSVQPGSSAK